MQLLPCLPPVKYVFEAVVKAQGYVGGHMSVGGSSHHHLWKNVAGMDL